MPAPVQICDMACKMIISIKSQVSSAFIHQSRFIIHIPVADNNTTDGLSQFQNKLDLRYYIVKLRL